NQRGEDYERFETVIAKIPEIIEAYSIGGGYDYLLKFVCGDVRDYQILSEKMINSDVGIDKFFSHIVIKPVKAYRACRWPISSIKTRIRLSFCPDIPLPVCGCSQATCL
ncbi:Lrp/AsnC ligand binding domain-containing protein, partial [Elstera litoralis]|uniref:Lrp/AsnC ligand binding domain-containing protein n=1 Tax=Elstera litoralis TaxID=552518 RepID=UPI0018DCDBBC